MLRLIIQIRFGLILTGTVFFLTTGCNRMGIFAHSDTLAKDAVHMTNEDLAGPGPQQVVFKRLTVSHQGENLSIALFQPARPQISGPAIVFLPGRMAPDDQYESYARALASRGFIVAVHGWYSVFTRDTKLARDANVIAEWLIRTQGADSRKLGVAGHSMGGKDAVLAAAQYGVFAGVVAIDPDDNGKVSVVRDWLAWLRAPLLLIGAEDAWRASSVCAPKATNYLRFFEQAPPGTIELTLKNADHVQVMDEPDRFGYGICRCGKADSRQVRMMARWATVGFFVQHLMGGPALLEPPPDQALIRVAQNNYIIEN